MGKVVLRNTIRFPSAFLILAGLSVLADPGHAACAKDLNALQAGAVLPGATGNDDRGGCTPVMAQANAPIPDDALAWPVDGSVEMVSGGREGLVSGHPSGEGAWMVEKPLQPLPPLMTGKDGAPMVLVPAGTFTMGSPEGTTHARPDEFPEHEVYVKDFYIDQFEVTVDRYGRFVYEENRAAPGPWGFIDKRRDAKKPVVSMTWQEASDFCQWVDKRLPTEAEWEKAARGTDKRTYPWGESTPGSHTANFGHVWEPDKIYSEKLQEVGTYERGKSPYGAYDMAGNVWEWVQDWYGENYYQTSPRENPPGPASGEFKVLRGGSWNDEPIAIRSAVRNWDHPSEGEVDIGFRCVQDIP